MRLLVDAQLPLRLANALVDRGHDVVHTSQFPGGSRTPDLEVSRIADSDGRIVVTKDRDFVDSHVLTGSPRSLLIVSTGNISNDELLGLFLANLTALQSALASSRLVELSYDAIVIHA